MSLFNAAMPRASRLAMAVALASIPFPVVAADPVQDTNPTTLDKVRVVGKRTNALGAEATKTPGGVSVVDGEEFYRRPVHNISDMLRYVPGVWSQNSTGGDGAFISIRGSNLDATNYDGNGVKLFQDGLPITAADGNNHNRFQDPLATRHAVIARGANALTYGASTLGGAVDSVSPTARNSDPSQIYIGAGSHGLATTRASLGGILGNLDGMLSVEGKQWDGFRAHSKQERAGIHGNLGWQVSDDLSLRLFADYIDNEEELANALTRAQVDADRSQANLTAITGHLQWNVETARLAAKGEWSPGEGSRLEFGLSWETQDLYHPIVDKVMVDFDGPGPMQPVEVFSLLKNTVQDVYGGMLRWNLQRGAHDLLVGVNFGYTTETGGNYRNDAGRRDGLSTVVDNHADSTELFVVDRWSFAPNWLLVYGAQGVITGRDVRNTTVSSGTLRNPKADYSAFNPRVGVIRTLEEGSEAYASVSRMFEAPTSFELTDDVRGGNATLEPMRGSVLEIGLRGEAVASDDAARWHWDVSAYYSRIRDEILSVDSPTATGTSLSANIDRTVHAGIEALVGASMPVASGALRIEPVVSATFNHFRFDGDAAYGDNRLPAAPRYSVRGEVMLRYVSGVYAGPTFDLVGKRWADFANTYSIDAYQLLGMRAGWSNGRWDLFCEVRNLTDEDWITNVSVRDLAPANAAILQPGEPRSAYFGLRYRF